jgi:GxxExxY protein
VSHGEHRGHRGRGEGIEDEHFDAVDEPDPELNRITNAVIGAAIEVHRALGPGFIESVYERALILEMSRRGIRFRSQARCNVLYKGESVGDLRLDFIVNEIVIVEIKAVDALAPIHTAQAISYLKATGLRLAILLNFNVPLMKDGIKRIAL